MTTYRDPFSEAIEQALRAGPDAAGRRAIEHRRAVRRLRLRKLVAGPGFGRVFEPALYALCWMMLIASVIHTLARR